MSRTLKLEERLTLQKRHKWFSATHPETEEWDGPFSNLEDAVANAVKERTECDPEAPDGLPVYIAQGRLSTAKAREEFGVDWKWWVESETTFVITATPK